MASAEKETRIDDSDVHSLSSSSTTTPEQVHHNDAHDDLERAVTEKSHHTSQGNATKVVTALDWTGPDDPENPENWSSGKKAFHIAYVGLQCFVMYVSPVNCNNAILTTFQNFRILCLQPGSPSSSKTLSCQHNSCNPTRDRLCPRSGCWSHDIGSNQ